MQRSRLRNEELHRNALTVGVAAVSEMLEEVVRQVCGPSGTRTPNRQAYRHGTKADIAVMGGQKVGIEKARVRSIGGSRKVYLITSGTCSEWM